MAEVAIIKAAIPVLTQAYNFLKNEVSDAEIYAFSNDVAAVKRAFELIVEEDKKRKGQVKVSGELLEEIQEVMDAIQKKKPLTICNNTEAGLFERYGLYEKNMTVIRAEAALEVQASMMPLMSAMMSWLGAGPEKVLEAVPQGDLKPQKGILQYAGAECEWKGIQKEVKDMMMRMHSLKGRLDTEILAVLYQCRN